MVVGAGTVSAHGTDLTNVIKISAGANHVLALTKDGEVYTWGKNNAGQLGTGNRTNSLTIAKIANKITDISCAGNETIVKDIEGNIYGTGQNTNGELGNGENENFQHM